MARNEYDNSPLTPLAAGFALFAVVLAAGNVIAVGQMVDLPPIVPEVSVLGEGQRVGTDWLMDRSEPARFDDMVRTTGGDPFDGMIRER